MKKNGEEGPYSKEKEANANGIANISRSMWQA